MKSIFLKQIIFILRLLTISVLSILIFSSCSKEETEINNNYYVKYVIKAPGPYGSFSNWTASTPDGTYSNSGYQVRGWDQTYGPVKEGFNCRVQIEHFQGGTPTIEIYVSKNDEPFALKANVTGGSASYTINF